MRSHAKGVARTDTSKKLMGSSDCRLNSLRKLWVNTAIEWRSKELNSIPAAARAVLRSRT